MTDNSDNNQSIVPIVLLHDIYNEHRKNLPRYISLALMLGHDQIRQQWEEERKQLETMYKGLKRPRRK